MTETSFLRANLSVIAIFIGVLFWFGLYFYLYALGWPGDPHPCANPPYCFCETVHAGTLAAQKINTWSDLGFVFAAIFIAFHARGKFLKQEESKGHLYTDNLVMTTVYASAILYMGPGSMFFHGAMTQWGGWMDVISMYAFVFFIIAYLIYRSWNLSLKLFYLMYFASLLFSVGLSVFFHGFSSEFFRLVAILLVVLALLQRVPLSVLSVGRKKDVVMNGWWLIAALSFFAVAIGIWTQSDSGGPLCYPDSFWQGHAAWHLLSAAMTVCIHFYFCSEKREA